MQNSEMHSVILLEQKIDIVILNPLYDKTNNYINIIRNQDFSA